MDDFYDLLEVSEDATQDDIKRAWRGKAREYHPDVNDDARATVQFKTLQKAYEVLSDETERAAYDRMGHADYVDQRLDGLPTAGMTRPNDATSAGSRWRTNSGAGGRSRASGSSNRRGSSGGASSRDSSSRTASGSSASRTRSEPSGRNSSRTGSAASSGSSARSSRGRTAANGSASNRTAGSRSSRGGSKAGPSGSSARAKESAGTAADPAGATARHPLWYGWTATLLAGVAYLGGLAAYLDANAGAIASFAAALSADPAAALLADHGLVAPGAFAVGAATAAPGPALAFPATAALLAVVFLAVVGKFGKGKAYLYVLGALAPLASLAVGPVVAVPAAGATLALVVLLPVVATTLFLADAGRFLVADG